MPVLKYKDPGSGLWVNLSSTGGQGSPGPPGPTSVSTDTGNAAVLGSDNLIYVDVTRWETPANVDAKIAAGMAAHEAAANPHPTYLTQAEAGQLYEAKGAVAAHAAAADPHTPYAKVTVSSVAPSSPGLGDLWIVP